MVVVPNIVPFVFKGNASQFVDIIPHLLFIGSPAINGTII